MNHYYQLGASAALAKYASGFAQVGGVYEDAAHPTGRLTNINHAFTVNAAQGHTSNMAEPGMVNSVLTSAPPQTVRVTDGMGGITALEDNTTL